MCENLEGGRGTPLPPIADAHACQLHKLNTRSYVLTCPRLANRLRLKRANFQRLTKNWLELKQ